MLLVYDIVRTLLGKVLVFLVLVVLLFGAALAIRHIASEGPELFAQLDALEALLEQKHALEDDLASQDAALAEAESDRDALLATLDGDAATRTGEERARLQGPVETASAASDAAQATLDLVAEEARDRRDAWFARERARWFASCDEGIVQAVSCWYAQRRWDRKKAELERAGNQQVERATAEARAAAEGAAEALHAARQGLTDGLQALERELGAAQAEALRPHRAAVAEHTAARADTAERLAAVESELAAARTPQQTRLLTLRQEWRQLRRQILGLVLFLLLAPYLKRTLWYWVLLPVAERRPPIRLVDPAAAGHAHVEAVEPSLAVRVTENRPLLVRPTFVTSHEGQEGHRWIYDWRYPFVSYAAGLVLLNRYTPGDAPDADVLVADPLDGHPELMLLTLRDHPGIVLHPRHLVGVQGPVTVRSVWRFGSVHAWATLQFRYLLFGGTGALVLSGGGHIRGQQLDAGDLRTLQSRVLGFDSRLAYATKRTGSFVQYLLGRAEPIEDRHAGDGLVLTQTALPADAARSPVERALDAILGGLGKLLGF